MEGCTYFLLYGDSRPPSRNFCVGEVGMACKEATAVHEIARQS